MPRCQLSLSFVLAAAVPGQSNSLFISGSVITSHLWNAATNAGNGTRGSCSVTSGQVHYYSAPFFTDTTAGSYRLSLFYPSYQSGFVYLYQDAFEPADPCAGIVAFGSAPVANLTNLHLDARRQYVFVTSEDMLSVGGGAFQVTIDGPPGSQLNAGALHGLSSPVTSISLANGGAQPWDLDAGRARARQTYFVIGSASGVSPGVLLPGNLRLPLNYDWWFAFTAALPNVPSLCGSLGQLDAAGTTHVGGLILPPGLPAVCAGFTVHHAFVTFGVSGAISFVSNPLALRLVP